MTAYRHKDVLAILARLTPGVEPATLKYRLKQWCRMGIPEGVNVGRGAKCNYTERMVWDIAIINAMQQMGIPPANGISLLRNASADYTDSGLDYHLPHGTISVDIERIKRAMVMSSQETE